MARSAAVLLLLVSALGMEMESRSETFCLQRPGDNLGQYQAVPLGGSSNQTFAEFEGKIALVVNLATY